MARPWDVPLPPDLADRASRTAREVATRLRDPERLRADDSWEPHGLARGHPGLAILFATCAAAFPEEDWRVTARAHMEVAAEKARARREDSTSLFHGLAGVDFSALAVSGDPAFDEVLLPAAQEKARRLGTTGAGMAGDEFDVVSGLAGTGAYLLSRGAPALEHILEAFVRITSAGDPSNNWYTPAHLLGERERARYPHGLVNCGLAHGLPGPLALLALADRQGLQVDRSREAIHRLAAWLVEHRVEDDWGVNWPSFVPVVAAEPEQRPARAAWCYGAPGVARSLWLAADALAEPSYRELAVDTMEAVYRRPVPERRLEAPTFCHGISGLLQITLRFAHDTKLPLFDEAVSALCAQLLDAFDLSADRAGLVEGAAGVALVLLAGSAKVEPSWDRMFLLS